MTSRYLKYHLHCTYVVEELRKELREKQVNLNSIKIDTNLFEGNGSMCISVASCLMNVCTYDLICFNNHAWIIFMEC